MLPKNEREKFKLIYGPKINVKKESKRIVMRNVKVDENNQYSNTMKKPFPCGCIKKQEKFPPLENFNIILNNTSYKDKIDHLFVVDITFCEMNGKFNKLDTPIFEKSKFIKPCERSVLQHSSVTSRNKEKNTINTLKHNKKTHSIMKEKS